ncbi:MAG: extracellular solute-binding protein [Candidatus Gastranaerophilaceae bacterium]|nr:extracellular solute-binding protein [Candidatus Gastranaerophilaceae bacterium]
MKKFVSVAIGLIVIGLCGIFTVKSIDNHTAKTNEVIFWTLQMSDFSSYMNGVISDFEKENPEIKIKWIDVPFSEGEKRTLASVLSDNPPDLINLNPDFSATLAQKGALYEIAEENAAQYNPAIINSLKYNGKLYSLPWYATSAVTIYNKDLINKAGVKVPQTYEQIVNIAPAVKSKSGAYVFLPNITENDTMLKILNKYGINSSETISSEKSEYVFNMFKTLYEKNLIPKESITQTHREALEKYMSENIVLFQAGANFLNMIKENAPSTYSHTDVAPQIVGELGQNDFSLMNFVIPEKAKHKSDAIKFALYLTNNKNQLELAKLTNVIAVNKETLNNEFYTTYSDNDLMAKARVISAKQLNHVEPVLKSSRNQKDINNLINTAVQNILLNKGNTKQLLEKLSKDWSDLLK